MTLGVLSVLAEISIVSDSVRQLKSKFLRLNSSQLGQWEFGRSLLFDVWNLILTAKGYFTDSGIGRRGRDECLVPKKGTLPFITHVSGKTKSSRGFLLGCPLRI